MGFSLRKCIAFSAFASLPLFCSCDKHKVGELPEVQKEHVYPESATEEGPAAPVAPTPAVTPTPADFFPGNKP